MKKTHESSTPNRMWLGNMNAGSFPRCCASFANYRVEIELIALICMRKKFTASDIKDDPLFISPREKGERGDEVIDGENS